MKTKFVISIFFIACLSVSAIWAQTDKRKKHFLLESGVAAQGYDVVAYFAGKASKGDKTYAIWHQGIKYQFANAKNLESFKANPDKYEPQYGGWCAYAMGYSGEKVEVNPKTFKIVNGKLHLFYNAYFNNTLNSWNSDEANLKKKADTNWTKIYK
jgi:YHS domain-containing protein